MNHATQRVGFALIACFAIVLSLIPAQNVNALSAADWKPGRIIDDSIFFNDSSMSVRQIQDFLNAKVPTCDRNHQSFFWMNGKYHQPPYTCLKEYNENPTTHENNIGRFNADGSPVVVSGGKSAAQIVWEAGQEHDINPQALLVMLQKETAIVTDTWAATWQYDRAMGYACPDSGVNGSANCDTSYYGFYNQVTSAARQLRRYVTYPDNYNFKSGVTRNIQWDVSAACGSSPVYIETQATAALYNYTPYQPNAMALSNLSGGQDDGCSAYGNRNFWVYFNNWFGSTRGPSYYAKYDSQNYPSTLTYGQSSSVTIRYRNSGNSTWYDSSSASGHSTQPVVLATTRSINRCSLFASPTWHSCARPALYFSKVYEMNGTTLATDQHAVSSGQIAEYTFTIQVPTDFIPGGYDEYFSPIREGASGYDWFMGADNVFLPLKITNPYSASLVANSGSQKITQNDRAIAHLKYKNTGSTPWYDSTSAGQAGTKPVVLATEGPINRSSPLGAYWSDPRRPTTQFSKVFEADGVTLAANQHVAAPGQIAELRFWITAPFTAKTGVYSERYRLIREGAKGWWIDDALASFTINILNHNISASYSSQNPYIVVSRDTPATMYFNFRNTGTTAWYDDMAWSPGILTIHLAATGPINRTSPVYTSGWHSASRPALLFSKVFEADGVTHSANQHVARPGQIVQFSFPVNTSVNTGIYTENFQPIVEGAPGWSWNMGGTVWQPITIK